MYRNSNFYQTPPVPQRNYRWKENICTGERFKDSGRLDGQVTGPTQEAECRS